MITMMEIPIIYQRSGDKSARINIRGPPEECVRVFVLIQFEASP